MTHTIESTGQKVSVFEKVQNRVPEQERINCPFCGSGFVDEKEHRPSVKCPACNGYAERAVGAIREVETAIENLDEFSSEEIAQFVRKLGAGLYRAEIRAYLVKNRHGREE